ncbi:uncharacterized protein LOC117341611 [Pecten maximus]|uniref:uncharacterized protein LOC117341611 n=1 Tax=Pecten maximus TaxID=6579 RepID=UPI00145800FA|nr:uncharacterized protein LOC117341611 [Pecten maximus]
MVHLNNIFGCFLLVFSWPFLSAKLTCILCNDAASIEDCIAHGSLTCRDDEYCFLEKSTTDSLTVLFNAGCRSRTVCSIMASLAATTGKRSLVNCANCCNDNSTRNQPCNGFLCGQMPNITAPAKQCQQCPNPVASATDCPYMVNCKPTELCYSDIYTYGGSTLRYMRGCREKSLCGNGTAVHNTGRILAGRSDFNLCSECCDGDQCSSTGCHQIQRK